MHTLSIIMPALNEEDNILQAIENSLTSMKKFNISGDIIVVNDGSIDNTKKIVEDLIKKYDSVQLINHEKPMGIGYSFMDGIKFSTKDFVVMFPGDNENNPDSALEFFYLSNNVDVIIPFIANIEVRNRFRRVLSNVYRFIINLSFGINKRNSIL